MRQCDGCTVCCEALGVDELAKPRRQRCCHLGSTGCGAYVDRPASCRAFACLWLMGHLTEADRPDRLGVIFTTTAHPELGTLPLLVEWRPGALKQPAIQNAIERLSRKCAVVLMDTTGTRRVLPPQSASTEPTIPITNRPALQPVELAISAR